MVLGSSALSDDEVMRTAQEWVQCSNKGESKVRPYLIQCMRTQQEAFCMSEKVGPYQTVNLSLPFLQNFPLPNLQK